jgi:hypothetical protein
MTTTPASPAAAPPRLFVDTTERSFPHSLMRDRGGRQRPRAVAYMAAILLTYVPMLIVVLFTNHDVEPTFTFFVDWNIAFMFLVTLPTLLVLALTDDNVLRAALDRIQIDGILSLPDAETTKRLQSLWRERFRRLNLEITGLAVVVGSAVTYAIHRVFAQRLVIDNHTIVFWAAPNGDFHLRGYVFLYGIFVFSALLAIYLARIGSISFLLRDIVSHSDLNMLPGHPDRCGGLRPIGRLGLRNQYALTVCGVNVALLGIEFHYLFGVDLDSGRPRGIIILFAAMASAYVILAPIVFLGPLLSFREGMKRAKVQLMSEVAQRLRVELQRLREQLPAGRITREDEELIDRLRKVGMIIDELPVWPFDASTLRRFLTVYGIPLAGGLAADLFNRYVR